MLTGIAFEQGKILPTPETVPFRLTRDVVDGMGIAAVEGVFRRYVRNIHLNVYFFEIYRTWNLEIHVPYIMYSDI